MLKASRVLLLISTVLIQRTKCDSRIEVFPNANCEGASSEFVGPNSGRCTSLLRAGNFSSFRVKHLDSGCAVTIYAHDETSDICSGAQKVAVPFQNCYNSTWVYYSIDGCNNAPDNPSSSASVITSTSSESSSTTSTTATDTTSIISSSSFTTRTSRSPAHSSATATPSAHHDHTNVGAIAGGTVGGVVFGIILAVIGVVLFRRSRRAKRDRLPEYPGQAPMELEVSRKEVEGGYPAQELPSEHVAEAQGAMVHELPENEDRSETGEAKSPRDVLKD